MRRPALALLLLLPALGGCFQFRALLRLQPDGSATIEESALLSQAVLASFREPGAAQALWPLDLDSLRARAARLGPGVRFVRLDTVRTAGASGYRAVYAVDDVAAVRYWFDAGTLTGRSGGGFSGVTTATSGPGPTADAPLTFERAGGALRVRVPQPPPPTGPPPALDPAAVAASVAGLRQQFASGQGEAMRQQLADARYRVELAGPFAGTDAAHQADSVVTLVDVPFAAFLDLARDKPELVARAQLLREAGYVDARALLATLAQRYGVRFEAKPEVTVRFR